jgi:tRNA U34 5-methylaminomethyl-2-thiouridine-forming methyltransferase MnmC
MDRKIILTNDGSHSIEIEGTNETYHSRYGAIRESQHVFIEAGLKPVKGHGPVYIFEMGFGTGLNALLTFMEAEKKQQEIYYETVELFPLTQESVSQLNYCAQLQREDLRTIFDQLHSCEWEKEIMISPFFSLKKIRAGLVDYKPSAVFNLMYHDAFAPNTQPELWTKEIFQKLFDHLADDGLLVTYCSKGDVRRAMQSAGFLVEKLQGPEGKREMIRGLKKSWK